MSERMNKVCGVIADVFAIDPAGVTMDSSPQSIEAWDSMGHLNLILALEQTFGVQFTPEEVAAMTSVRAIDAALAHKTS